MNLDLKKISALSLYIISIVMGAAAHGANLTVLEPCGQGQILYSIGADNVPSYHIRLGTGELHFLSGGMLNSGARMPELMAKEQLKILKKSGAPICLENKVVAYEMWLPDGHSDIADCVWLYDIATNSSIKTTVSLVDGLSLTNRTYRSGKSSPSLSLLGYTFIVDETFNCN